jgi:ribonucleoside-diphosphate reductase alpha chain
MHGINAPRVAAIHLPQPDRPELSSAPRGKRQRAELLHGSTRKITSPLGDVFVTINLDADGTPFEVFAAVGKAGSALMADVEAIGRLVSLALRFGVPVEEIYRQLRGISSDRAIGRGAQKVLSVPDAIAQALGFTLDASVGDDREPPPRT